MRLATSDLEDISMAIRETTTLLGEALARAGYGLIFVGGMSLFLNLLVLVQPLFMFQVFDRVLGSGRVPTLVALVVVAGFALLVLGVLDAIRNQALVRISVWLERALGPAAITASLQETLRGRSIGAQALRDLTTIRGFINSPAILPIFDAPWTPIFIVIVWLVHSWLGMLALGAAGLLFALAVLTELTTRRPLREANEQLVTVLHQAEAGVRNAEVVQALGMLPALLRRWETGSGGVLGRQIIAADRAGVFSGASKFVRSFVQIAMLALGAYLVLLGELTAGGMIASSILLGRALAPVEQAIAGWKSFIGARTAHGRLNALLKRNPEPETTTRLPEPAGKITAESVVFVAPGGTTAILKGLSFQIEPGEMVAVVGPSASGKSTLCRLLVGIWPPSRGSLRLDGAEIHAWDRTDFGRHVGYLPQDFELFSGSVKENIARLGPASEEAVIEAADLAGAHEMILHLPEGYATQIGPDGPVLSGGQRQRIGLARALFGQPRVVVLDEPNANLDQDGDDALLEAIAKLKRRRATVVMVAHRPSLLTHVDRVLVMRDGAISMLGPRDEVLLRITDTRSTRRAVAVS
jgi:PrtD family type I secretion system ABC transporter